MSLELQLLFHAFNHRHNAVGDCGAVASGRNVVAVHIGQAVGVEQQVDDGGDIAVGDDAAAAGHHAGRERFLIVAVGFVGLPSNLPLPRKAI